MIRNTTFLSALLLLFLHDLGFSQVTFFKHLGGAGFNRGVTVEEVAGSGFVVTGYTNGRGAGGEDVFLIRTDSVGDTLWTKTFGGPGNENGWAVRQTDDGGFVIAGFTDSFGAGGQDVYLIRTDATGDTLWTKTFGGPGDEYGWDIRNTVDGGFIIAAETNSIGNGGIDAYLIKTDASGNEEWAEFYGGGQDDRVFSVQQTPDSGYVTVGITYSFGAGDRDAYLLKTNASGDLEWDTTYGGADYDVGHTVSLTDDGGYVIIGYGDSFSSNGSRDVYLIKTDANGQQQWIKNHGEVVDERGINGQQTSDGGYVAIGFTDNNWDVYLIKTDEAGNLLWTRTFGDADRIDFGYTVQETADGGFILTGHSATLDQTESNVLLIKTNPEGTVTDIAEPPDINPQQYNLEQNYPNPFNPKTVISYELKADSYVELTVYDMLGRHVKTLVKQKQNAGKHSIILDASGLASGIYLYKLETGAGFLEAKKFLLLK